jgi:3-oxoacyl-[acyl-carrier protein] reductase
MDLGLKGKVALITGSTKGIGRAIAENLAAEGCHLGICARSQDEVNKAVEELSATGVNVVGAAVDVADADSLASWVDACTAQLGGIDIFVPNVSAGGADASEDGWRANFEADMLSTWRGVQLVLPWLEKSSSGVIIAISSTAALEAFAGAVPYSAMKAALLNYTGNLAQDLAPKGIRVNSVSPGPVFIDGIKSNRQCRKFMRAPWPQYQWVVWAPDKRLPMPLPFWQALDLHLRRAPIWSWMADSLSACSSNVSPT